MKKKRFYNNKNRNQKWTEEPQGRALPFADKYAEEEQGTNKFRSKAPESENYGAKKAKAQKKAKAVLIVAMCIVFISVGYIGADVHIIRSRNAAINSLRTEETQEGGIAQATVPFAAMKAESISLDGSVMLDAVISDAQNAGFSSICFDAKRSDGTIGYASSLALADTFSAVSSPASKPAESVQKLIADDILPVARICCYKDNVVPAQAKQTAVLKGKKLYKDSAGNTYLNPDDATVYNYIRNIIQELGSYGVEVFVLTDCSLPEEISEGYGDGFETLRAKLTRDLGSDYKIVNGVEIEINSENLGKIEPLPEGSAYVISTALDKKTVSDSLIQSGISSFTVG